MTSPPYWGLRDYGIESSVWGGDPECLHQWTDEIRLHKGGPTGDTSGLTNRGANQARTRVAEVRAGKFCLTCGAWLGTLGFEPNHRLYVEHMVEIFALVWDVLAKDGTVWLNLGDSYAISLRGNPGAESSGFSGGLKPKDLCLIPARVAIALQEWGWTVRQDIIWHKPNPMPESVRDRCTKAHEYIFLLSKQPRYYFDAEAISEPAINAGKILHRHGTGAKDRKGASKINDNRTRIGLANWDQPQPESRNKRSVWTVTTQRFSDAHFATFPPGLIEPCILAGSRPGDVVLDPFMGSGTVAQVAECLGRQWIGCEANPEYLPMIRSRTQQRNLPLDA